MAQKLDASLALEGQFSAEGLAAMSADSGSLTMELAKSLVENIDFGEAERVWERFSSGPSEDNAELFEDGEPVVVTNDKPPSLPKQQILPLFETVPRGHYVQRLLFVP